MDVGELPLFARSAEAPRHLTVSELTQQIRSTLEPKFTQIWVQGEVSNYRPATSGHAYFSLKDDQASISVALFGWGAKRKTAFELKDGLQILCRGKISVYPPRGNYQLIVDQIEPLGAGALQLAFEQLKTRLQSEGLFDPARKRPVPLYPTTIAVITSPSGAAIQDMLNILHRRARHIRVLVVPALVQGNEAPKQIIRALETVNRNALADLVVLARGGGSIEDLWAFNDEALARAIAASILPTISAVGHETDFTISDFVADLRAPTPSAAAEIVSGHWVDAILSLKNSRERLVLATRKGIQTRKTLLQHIATRVVSPRDKLREFTQRCDDLALRMERVIRHGLQLRKSKLEQISGKLDALSPLRVLERGYSLVRNPEAGGTIIKSASKIQKGQKLQLVFHDGERSVQSL